MNLSIASKEHTNSSPGKVLYTIFTKEASGLLTINEVSDETISWKVYVYKGKVLFATSAEGVAERLSYLLNRYLKKKINLTTEITDDYQYIYQLATAGHWAKPQHDKLLIKMTQEALIQCLSLPKIKFKFDKNVFVKPSLISVSGQDLVKPVKKQISSWIQMRAEIISPFQRVSIKDLDKIVRQSEVESKNPDLLNKLAPVVNEYLCLYELANHLSQHILESALLLKPLVKAGSIKMLPYNLPPLHISPLVACIDDSKAIQRIVKMTLEASGFRVNQIIDPAIAMTSFVQEKPDIILMDINMPGIDGYKLSYMLRQSSLLRDIPIIIITGRDGDLDHVLAKMVGAIDYITKPFTPEELLNRINSYLHSKKT